MTREEFCNLLKSIRLRKGISRYRLCLNSGFRTTKLIRIETASHNFRTTSIFDILNVLKCNLQLYDENQSYILKTYIDLIKTIKNIRTQIYSQTEFASKTAFSIQTLKMIESGRYIMSIDVFLNYIQALGLKINIIEND